MSSQINYLDAFDDVVIEEYSLDDEIISLDSSDEGEYEVTFITDDEDEDDDFEAIEEPKELPEESKKDRLKWLNEKYKDDLEKCNHALEGKLNWVSTPVSSCVNDSLDKNEYPDINAKPKKEKKFSLKPIHKKCQKPMNVDIWVRDSLPSQINIIAPPKPQAFKKNWFCKNLIQTGTCKFGDRCIFAHTLAEVEANTEQCKFGQRCNNVKMINPKQYINSGKYKCVRLHPAENINSFIKRVQ
jgi:hypothetical protein